MGDKAWVTVINRSLWTTLLLYHVIIYFCDFYFQSILLDLDWNKDNYYDQILFLWFSDETLLFFLNRWGAAAAACRYLPFFPIGDVGTVIVEN